MLRFISVFDDGLEKISRWGLVSSFFIILCAAVAAIVLRWLGMSPMWLEPMIRHLVFLSAFLGGSLATSKGVHIKVDLLTHLVDRSSFKFMKWLHRNCVGLFCFITTLTLTIAGKDFFLVEREFGTEAFLGLHTSYLVMIIPFGMGLICLRFLNQLLMNLIGGESRDHHRV